MNDEVNDIQTEIIYDSEASEFDFSIDSQDESESIYDSLLVESDIADPAIYIDTQDEIEESELSMFVDSEEVPDPVIFINAPNEDTEITTYILGGVKAIAGQKAWIFNTTDEMLAWLSDPNNIKKLTPGDDIKIKDENSSNYWWDGTTIHLVTSTGVSLLDVATVFSQAVDNVFGG